MLFYCARMIHNSLYTHTHTHTHTPTHPQHRFQNRLLMQPRALPSESSNSRGNYHFTKTMVQNKVNRPYRNYRHAAFDRRTCPTQALYIIYDLPFIAQLSKLKTSNNFSAKQESEQVISSSKSYFAFQV